MKKINKKALPHLSRHYRSNTHWYIQHDEGRLKIELHKIRPTAINYVPGATYYTNATTIVSITNKEEYLTHYEAAGGKLYYDIGELTVQWVLPNGNIIDGTSIDTEVEKGTTLCICNDFYSCGVTVDCCIAKIDKRDLPPFQGPIRTKSLPWKDTIADWPKQNPILGASRSFYTGGIKICGTPECPSSTRGTIEDIESLIGGAFKSRIRINYAPYITGDLGNIKHWNSKIRYDIWGTNPQRKYLPIEANPYSNTLRTDFTYEETCMSIHHCGVHGTPKDISSSFITDWEYYACPNASPEDFDNFIEEIFKGSFYGICGNTVDGVGFTWNSSSSAAASYNNTLICPNESALLTGYSYEAGKTIIPAYGNLKISNRTMDAEKRAERLSILRDAGWVVEEIDDSLEEGIYASAI